jgi:hypothetical protein
VCLFIAVFQRRHPHLFGQKLVLCVFVYHDFLTHPNTRAQQTRTRHDGSQPCNRSCNRESLNREGGPQTVPRAVCWTKHRPRFAEPALNLQPCVCVSLCQQHQRRLDSFYARFNTFRVSFNRRLADASYRLRKIDPSAAVANHPPHLRMAYEYIVSQHWCGLAAPSSTRATP